MATIWRWSGREVRALRAAHRMSIRDFAAHLGVSARMVSKWEAGGAAIHPRPVNQAALDTSLSRSDSEVRVRFAQFVGARRGLPAPLAPADAEHLRHPVDGKRMVLIDSGPIGPDGNGRTRWLSAYYLDVYPTTNGDYARFVAATGHPAPPHWPHGDPPPDRFDHPVVFVSWHDAQAYASWSGKALPTRTQWTKAAGPGIYPWGDDPSTSRCNVRDDRIGGTAPVGLFPAGVSAYGVHDLGGNVWEWCSTEVAPGRFALKGGAFTTPLNRAEVSVHHHGPASMRDGDIGFRCAATDLW